MRSSALSSLLVLLVAQACSSDGHNVQGVPLIAPGGAPVAGVPATPNTQVPVAGSGASAPTTNPAMPDPTQTDPTAMMPAMNPPAMAKPSCGLKTKYPGDEACLVPPPPELGFQIHVGPSNYDSPEAQYVLGAGAETTVDFRVTSTNDKDVFFYYREYGMRTGSHHMIVTKGSGGVGGMGQRIATANRSEEYPTDGKIAPENVGVGIALAPRASINVNLHSINVSDTPTIREIWINFWYRDPALVTEPVEELFQTGDVLLSVAPGEDKILGPYSCNIRAAGRMLWFYGHRHANNVRFSAWRVRGGKRELFYESYHYEEPMLLDFSSNVVNTPPDPVKLIDGGWNGILDLAPGDQLSWECHIINKTNGTLRFTNNTFTGEMCIMDGEMVGTNCGL